ncbi:MAG: hypothetical protein KBD06_04250 [Candidatus Pacebacteria bacterium]|nr:hypothetical protein [Candidatus Paceibacterota bacterium]
MSPRRTIEAGTAHCFEGALLAAAALMYHDQKPLIMDLQSARGDTDHVVAIFKQGGRWGAISKTNHGVLRYREPVYATVRELALSYFHEYFLQVNGKKTLRAYSQPFDLSKYKPSVWFAAEDELVDIVNDLEDSIHYPIVTGSLIKKLRKADAIEVLMATHEEFPKKRK